MLLFHCILIGHRQTSHLSPLSPYLLCCLHFSVSLSLCLFVVATRTGLRLGFFVQLYVDLRGLFNAKAIPADD